MHAYIRMADAKSFIFEGPLNKCMPIFYWNYWNNWKAIVSPKQFPCKSYASPISRLFLGTDLQRTWNGLGTEVEGRRISSTFFLWKNFFALTLHPYIVTLYNTLCLRTLYRFQIYANPTLTLHQPYTNHACQGMKLIINNGRIITFFVNNVKLFYNNIWFFTWFYHKCV